MERNYRLASMFGGLAGIVTAVFLATLALAGPHLGAIFSENLLQPHHAAPPHNGVDQQEGDHAPIRCSGGPCGPPSVHSTGESFAGFMPVFEDTEQGPLRYLSFDGDDAHRQFREGGPSFFGLNFGGGGGGANFPRGGVPPLFTTGGGVPPGFPGPPPPSGGSSPPGGPNSPPGGGDPPPDGGDPPPNGGTLPPGGNPTPAIVPEPAAWALFIFGVAAIGFALRSTRPRP